LILWNPSQTDIVDLTQFKALSVLDLEVKINSSSSSSLLTLDTHPAIRLPVKKEAVLVNLEKTVCFDNYFSLFLLFSSQSYLLGIKVWTNKDLPLPIDRKYIL